MKSYSVPHTTHVLDQNTGVKFHTKAVIGYLKKTSFNQKATRTFFLDKFANNKVRAK